MCEPRKTDVIDVVTDAVAGTARVLAAAARWTVRVAARRFSNEQLEYGRWVLAYRFVIEAVLAAVTVYYLGYAAIWVFLGVAAASLAAAFYVHNELVRRRDEEPETEVEPEIEVAPDGRPHLEAVS